MTNRYSGLDQIRAVTLLSMMAYHWVWDMVYLFHHNWQWYQTDLAYLWQQSICWTFIFLAGFCWNLGSRRWKRGAQVFGGGLLISLVTCLWMPEARILFGVLTLLGTCMLLMIPIAKITDRWAPGLGEIGCLVLFAITRNVNHGTWGFEGWAFGSLSEGLYDNLFTAFLGFPPEDFFSADYFSLIPWIFLFMTGYFCCRLMDANQRLKRFQWKKRSALEWIGRHSLILYLIHQPILYGVCFLIAMI